jgi:hypothetical protein
MRLGIAESLAIWTGESVSVPSGDAVVDTEEVVTIVPAGMVVVVVSVLHPTTASVNAAMTSAATILRMSFLH